MSGRRTIQPLFMGFVARKIVEAAEQRADEARCRAAELRNFYEQRWGAGSHGQLVSDNPGSETA